MKSRTVSTLQACAVLPYLVRIVIAQPSPEWLGSNHASTFLFSLPLKYTVTQHSIDSLALCTVLAFCGSRRCLGHTAAGGDAAH